MQLHDRISQKSSYSDNSLLGYYHQEKSYKEGIAKTIAERNRYRQGLRALPNSKEINPFQNYCLGNQASVDFMVKNYQALRGKIALPKITRTCVKASLMRSNKTSGWNCQTSSSAPQSIGSAGEDGPCITDEVANYLTWATNKAISCLNDPLRPIDPLLIYKKINNETGFSFFQASSGGVGLGQLTGTAVKEIRDNTKLIEKILKSGNPACFPFREALAQKAKLSSSTQFCQWVEPSEGLARNLIYSIGYFLHARDHLTKNMNRAFNKLGIEDARFANEGALATYGAAGLNNQEPIISAAQASLSNYDRFHQINLEKVLYLQQVEDKYWEALKNAELPRTTNCLEDPSQDNESLSK